MRRGAHVAVAVLLLAAGACGGDDAPRGPTGIVRTPAPEVGSIALPDASTGEAFALRAAPGEILTVYFGYTSCPDVCPTTLADLRFAARALGDDAARIDLAMITVDPERDDGERLTAYVQSFIDGAHALRTDDSDALAAAAAAFGATYEVTRTDDGVPEVAHSAFLYAVDEAGKIQLQWSFGTSSEDLEEDLRYLLEKGT